MTQTELSVLVGYSVSTINRHLKHGRVLDPKVIVRIFFITMGAVRPDDFYDLENVPQDIAHLMKSAKSRELRKANKRIAPLALAESNQTVAV